MRNYSNEKKIERVTITTRKGDDEEEEFVIELGDKWRTDDNPPDIEKVVDIQVGYRDG